MRHEQWYASFTEVRTTFLQRYCSTCRTGKILACCAEGQGPSDDNGSQAFFSKAYLRCEDCGVIIIESTIVPWPISSIEELFQRFERGDLPANDFETQLMQRFTRTSAKWA